MNLALCHCWKEWRTQRAVLTAYMLLICVGLCLGFLLVPEPWWLEDGRRAMALSWFVAAGVIGVVAFVAPALVRGEFGAKDDQFVRRLPGALGPSFGGKLVFLLLATAALPLVGLVCGELFLRALGQPWHDLFTWRYDGTVVFEWMWPAVWCGYALLLVPWVWAVGTWLPGGRMAIGGTGLLVLVLGVGTAAVLRQYPCIERGIAWENWLWAIVPLGFLVAGISWVKGRRGGGPLRSARFGLLAMAVGLAPPAAWLGNETKRYHHPDPQQLVELDVQGLSPDARFVLAGGAANREWFRAKFRIDLQTGIAEQVAGIDRAFTPELMPQNALALHGVQRYWRNYGQDLVTMTVLDLATGECTAIGYDTGRLAPVLPAELRECVATEVRANTPLRGPGGSKVWFDDDQMCIEGADGEVSRLPLPAPGMRSFYPAGHGFLWFGGTVGSSGLFDLTSREAVPPPARDGELFLVRSVVLFHAKGQPAGTWRQRSPGGEAQRCEPLQGCKVFGLFDDDRLLCAQEASRFRSPRLFLYAPGTNVATELALPAGVAFQSVVIEAPLHRRVSLIARDPSGRIWLSCRAGAAPVSVLVDTNGRVSTLPQLQSGWNQLIGWPDAASVLVREGARILRIDLATGDRTVLFPTQGGA
ncbi:MAG: hypothetical protein ABIP94_22055 [Planctomycetota bacterium]